MEVSLCGRKVWRRGFRTFLSVLSGYYGAARNDDGVCGGACQQEERYKEFP